VRLEKETGVAGRTEVREGGGNEEGGASSAVAEGTRGSKGAKTTGAASQDAAAGSADPRTSVEKGADGDKEVGEVEIEEVEGVTLGPAWDARDPSRRLGSGDILVSSLSLFHFVSS
jgi:hypothetical protein